VQKHTAFLKRWFLQKEEFAEHLMTICNSLTRSLKLKYWELTSVIEEHTSSNQSLAKNLLVICSSYEQQPVLFKLHKKWIKNNAV